MGRGMKRGTFFFWLSEFGICLSVFELFWKIYNDTFIGVFAAVAVSSILGRLAAISNRSKGKNLYDDQ